MPFTALPLCALLIGASPAAPPVRQEAPEPDAARRARARELSLGLTATPRLAGTIGSLRGARVLQRHLQEAGWKVELDEREVLTSLPRRIEVGVFEDGQAREPLLQQVARFDPDAIPPGDVPLYSAWSASGRVRAPVVAVGDGLREDYERLAARGVDVRGAIALARYGRAYRGVKVDLAQEHGCVGVLLYSEHDEDGAGRGPVWPAGPWKPGWEAQRGSVSPMGHVPGDPSTPGGPSPAPGSSAGSRASAARIAASLPRIPCQPIGSDTAVALRARLAPRALSDNSDDREERPVGPGPVEVLLDLDVPRELRAVCSVLATLPGTGDGLVLAGSHRDAWVRGAQDSGSGCVALLLAAEELGRRARAGWKGRHTLVLAFWDAEEQGLIGSTEWGEAHAPLLEERALIYVNADATVSGTRVGASGTPGMLALLRGVLERVSPAEIDSGDGHASLWQQLCARAGEAGPVLGLPGSGSDFAVFLHHLSIPVLELGFGGNSGGQYHTAFDDFAMMDRYLDPGWHGHALAGATLAELLATLSEAPGAGFDAAEASSALAQHARAAGPWLGIERSERLARAFEHHAAALRSARGDRPAPGENAFYRSLSHPSGLPGRPWFRNALWTPGVETGYSSETFPGLRRTARVAPESLELELERLIESIGSLTPGLGPAGAPAGAGR